MNPTRCLVLLLAAAAIARADVLPPAQDSSSLSHKTTLATGKAATLAVNGARRGFVLFNLDTPPADVAAADIAQARLRVYFPTITVRGDITVHKVSPVGTLWNETTTAS